MSGVVTATAIWDGSKLQLDDQVLFVAGVRRMKLGAGEEVLVRVERKAEAWRHSDVKHLFGHIYQPVVDYTGMTKTELHLLAKSIWMPEGATSLTELSREQMREYSDLTERWLREDIWEAFEDPGLRWSA
jgi:hypothetical protein